MLSYLVTAMLSACAGLVIGGLLTSSKTAFLSDRLGLAEARLAEQSRIMRELVAAMQELLLAVDERSAGGSRSRARTMLASCDAFLQQADTAD